MTEPGGELTISIHPSDGGVRITSTRPSEAPRVFVGKPVPEIAARLPLLYSVCATAQAAACARASEQLLGLQPSPAVSIRRALLLSAETAKEHLWRLLLDWPRALASVTEAPRADESSLATVLRAFLTLRRGMSADTDPLRPGAQARATDSRAAEPPIATLAGIAEQRVFSAPPREWLRLATDEGSLSRWAAGCETGPAGLVRIIGRGALADLGRNPVPRLDLAPGSGLLGRIQDAFASADADAFVLRPALEGRPHETTPLAREAARGELVAELVARHGNGLLPRLAALLVELARTLAALEVALGKTAGSDLDRLEDSLPALVVPKGPGSTAMGMADAARGLLVHWLEGLDDRVRGYRILAPTEWNFHPDGVVAQGLAAIARDLPDSADQARLRQRAALYVTAVDPCVPYRLEIDP